VVEGPWDDALQLRRVLLALHGEGLAGSCLAIRKDGPIVALQHALHNAGRGIVIHLAKFRDLILDLRFLTDCLPRTCSRTCRPFQAQSERP